ncbi:unnamed protein product [Sphagnum balticum]
MKSIVNDTNDDDGCRAVAHAADEKSMNKRRRQCPPSLAMAEAELGVAGGLVNGDRDHDCKTSTQARLCEALPTRLSKENSDH